MSQSSSTAKLLVVPSPVVIRLSAEECNDVLSYFDPDAVVMIGPQQDSYTTGQFDRATADSTPVVFAPLDTSLPESFDVMQLGNIQLVSVNTFTDVASIADAEDDGTLDTETETYVLSGLLDLNVDTDSLSTSLDGLADYRDALSPDERDGSYTHLLTGIKAGYAHTWDGLRVRGVGQPEAAGLPPLSCFTLDEDGHTAAESLDVAKLGLRAIHGVGSTTAAQLRRAGLTITQEVAGAPVEDLASIKGLGPKKARRSPRTQRRSPKERSLEPAKPHSRVPIPSSSISKSMDSTLRSHG